MVRARGSPFGLASIRSTSRTGFAMIAPYRTARPMTPEMTLRQLLAVEALTFLLIEAITRSTIGVVASPSRTSPIAGNTWFLSCRR